MYHCLHNRGSLTRALQVFVRNVGLVQFTRARRAHRSLRCSTRYKGSPQHSRHPSRPFISMPFSFSFRFSVPGITNPFASSSAGRRQPETEDQSTSHSGLAQTQLPSPIDSSWASIPAPAYRRRPSPSPASSDTKRSYSPAPLVRKRGWVPSSAEPSHAVMTASTSSGFLDTPAKYRDMAEQDERDDIDTEEVVVGTSDACLTSGRCMFFCRHLLLFFSKLRLCLHASIRSVFNSPRTFIKFNLLRPFVIHKVAFKCTRWHAFAACFAMFTPTCTTFTHSGRTFCLHRSFFSLSTTLYPSSDAVKLMCITSHSPTDLPPSKRRKGITGSVISTAFGAALIGAAVGLTVYRLCVAFIDSELVSHLIWNPGGETEAKKHTSTQSRSHRLLIRKIG